MKRDMQWTERDQPGQRMRERGNFESFLLLVDVLDVFSRSSVYTVTSRMCIAPISLLTIANAPSFAAASLLFC